MATPSEVAAAASCESDGGGRGFGSWLDEWLEVLGVDRAIYSAYILGVLQEEEEEEKLDALQGILSAFLEEDSLLNICKEIMERWSQTQNVVTKVKKDEVQAIAMLIKKQAQIVVKPKVVSKEEKQRKAALLAQYADITDEEDEADEKYVSGATMMTISSEKSLFRNTNIEDVLRAQKLERDSLRDETQKKKEQDKLQKEREKLDKQKRKEKKKLQRRARKR